MPRPDPRDVPSPLAPAPYDSTALTPTMLVGIAMLFFVLALVALAGLSAP